MAKPLSDIGLVGLAVMGQNLALNIADHGFQISVFNRTTEKTDKFVADNPEHPRRRRRHEDARGICPARSRSRGRSSSSSRPGKGTDAVIDGLTPLLEKGDIVIDGGNALWTDTIRREKAYSDKGLRFIGSGVSGGEEGARFGPSLMPGGDFDAWLELKPIWEADRRQGGRQDRQAAHGRRARQAGHGRRALHRLHRRRTARAITSRWSTTASSTATCR